MNHFSAHERLQAVGIFSRESKSVEVNKSVSKYRLTAGDVSRITFKAQTWILSG